MAFEEFYLWLIICLPFFGSVLLPFAGLDSEKFRNVLALFLVAMPLTCAALLVPGINDGLLIDLSLAGVPLFHADRLALFMSLVSLLVGLLIVIYSIDYISHYENRNEYFFLVVIFLGSMMGLVFSRNLLLLYLFWEVTAFACWRLIGFYREKTCVWKADKAFLVTVFGALTMLVGFILIYLDCGTFDLPAIHAKGPYQISNLATLLILTGIFSKSATLPLHTWLPDAGVAPSPVTALLHAAVLVKIGVYVFARLFDANFVFDEIWHTAVPLIAGTSAFVSAGAALVENDIKRIIAYSTVSQLGFIFLGLSIGNDVGLAGGLLFILMHGIAKGGLFLCAGIVEQNTHEKDIRKLGGLAASMPITAVAFLLCAFSVMGIPPFGGFFSKLMVLNGAVVHGDWWITGIFLTGGVFTIIYLLRVFSMVFLGAPRGDERSLPAEGSPLMVWTVGVLGTLALLTGVFVNFSSDYVRSTVIQMNSCKHAAPSASASIVPRSASFEDLPTRETGRT